MGHLVAWWGCVSADDPGVRGVTGRTAGGDQDVALILEQVGRS